MVKRRESTCGHGRKTYGRDDGDFNTRLGVVPRDAGIGAPVSLDDSTHGGRSGHSAMQLDIIDDVLALLLDHDQPFNVLVGRVVHGGSCGCHNERSNAWKKE